MPINNLIPTSVVVLRRDSKLLLVRHTENANNITDMYGFPGGQIEKHESRADAAVRELQEETGIVTQIAHLVPHPKTYKVRLLRKDGVKRFHVTVFLCKEFDDSGFLKETKETIPEWIDVAELEHFHDHLLSYVPQILHDLKIVGATPVHS